MNEYSDYFNWIEKGEWIRVSARAIIFNQARDRILIEKNDSLQNNYLNFIGGGVEVGETLQECIARELTEESNGRLFQAKYLFVVENFFPYKTELRHSLEHYFEITLDRTDIQPTSDDVTFQWYPINELPALDLRPSIVRDCIVDGTYNSIGRLVLRDEVS